MYSRSTRNASRGRRRIYAEDEVSVGEITVAPEATELVFETEDVAQLVAEVTGEDVEVVADEDAVTFNVGDEDFIVEADGTEEILESSRRVFRGKRPVSAAHRTNRRTSRPVSASTRSAAARRNRTVRRISR